MARTRSKAVLRKVSEISCDAQNDYSNQRDSASCAFIFAFVSPPASRADSKLRIMTATTDLAALAQEIGGEKVDVESVARGYQDPHFVEAKPSFLLKLRHAIFSSSSDSSWKSAGFLRSSASPPIRRFKLARPATLTLPALPKSSRFPPDR